MAKTKMLPHDAPQIVAPKEIADHPSILTMVARGSSIPEPTNDICATLADSKEHSVSNHQSLYRPGYHAFVTKQTSTQKQDDQSSVSDVTSTTSHRRQGHNVPQPGSRFRGQLSRTHIPHHSGNDISVLTQNAGRTAISTHTTSKDKSHLTGSDYVDHCPQLTLQRMDQSEQDFSERKQQYYNCQKQAEIVTTQPVSVPAVIKTNTDDEPPTPSSASAASRQPNDGDTIAGNVTFSDNPQNNFYI